MNKVTLSTPARGIQITPSKIICVGRNYVEHINELGNEVPEQMVLFVKPNSSITPQLHADHGKENLHYEAEICFMYQQGGFIAVAAGLDLTKRDLQTKLKQKGLPWERAKAFDGSVLFSDFIPLTDVDISELSICLKSRHQLLQLGHSQQMIFNPEQILKEIQDVMTLEDGDIVMTGTPKGVGAVVINQAYTASVLLKEQELVSETWRAS